MSEITVQSLSSKDPGLEEVEALIVRMYDYMTEHGLLLPLGEGGAAKLRRSMETSLGRTGMLVVARQSGAIRAFAYGMLRLTPDYLGGGLTGFVGHTFVDEALRGHGLGTRLFAELEQWFRARGAASIELQVLTGNADAIAFWQARGFRPELLQMRKLPG